MSKPFDSVSYYKHIVDSLKMIVRKPVVPYHFHLEDATIQAAFIIAATTILTVIAGFIFKDFFIPRWLEIRSRRITAQDQFALFKLNLMRSAISLNTRLHEIYRTRSHYLWSNTANNSFYEYKYKSSVYRLCVLLGWIRAYRLAESTMSISNTHQKLQAISDAIAALEGAFADGQRFEMSVAKAICSIYGIDIAVINQDILKEFSIGIDHLVNNYLSEHKKEYIADLSDTLKDQFINDFQALMTKTGIPFKPSPSHNPLVVKEVSIKLGLIYRDWQQAIGDLMLKQDEEQFSVISFKTFDEIWEDKIGNGSKWLKRAEMIFSKLDVRVDQERDSRIDQLILVYLRVYELTKILFYTPYGINPITKNKFNEIPTHIENAFKPS